jgi:hypothetical protein
MMQRVPGRLDLDSDVKRALGEVELGDRASQAMADRREVAQCDS